MSSLSSISDDPIEQFFKTEAGALCIRSGIVLLCTGSLDGLLRIQTNRDEARNDQSNMELKPMASSSRSGHYSIFSPPIPIVKKNLWFLYNFRGRECRELCYPR
ncbi:unnamed protein product [Anisakis simplex]|uniref:Uncharacterized protein n=1 Tax=Anisakis simplex TaxID=6269 RepID=A0A0M3J8K3_ANISI|nr:unnamed protein product [Anisakis simplex]